MNFGSGKRIVDIPKDIVDALSVNRLALIAGAGVSRDKPSNYPDFRGLATAAGKNFLRVYKKNIPFDAFFGQLAKDNNGKVHTWVKEYFTTRTSAPNDHHRSLIRLFGSKDNLRIITTNFDTHFSSAAKEVFEASLVAGEEEFCAPALPVGRDFNGVVYLHGKHSHAAKRLVLTDRDFGRAYLSEGWACRFLLDVLREYVVVFVGYSGEDRIVQYLAHGLAANDKRQVYAFPSGGRCTQYIRATDVVGPVNGEYSCGVCSGRPSIPCDTAVDL